MIASTLALAVIYLTGCFHYTPSRREIAEEGDNSVAGPEAFNSYQQQLHDRLDALIKDRAPLLDQHADQSYQLGPMDVVKVDVYGFSDLSGETAIGEDGRLNLSLVGSVDAAGRSVGQLQQDLNELFAKYLKNPKVRLSVSGYNAHRVSAVGAVVRPGWYPMRRPGYLLTDLLAEAGGAKDSAADRVYIIPAHAQDRTASETQIADKILADPSPSDPKRAGVEISLEDLVGNLDKPPLQIPLVDGDIVVVPEAGEFRVDGEVEKPGSFPVSRRTSALAAVAAAGGFTYAANVNEVEVIRDIGKGKKASVTLDLEKVAFRGSPDITLRSGDVVVVPSAPGRFRARQVVEAFRSVFRGGVTGSVRYQ